jgi:putative ATPase
MDTTCRTHTTTKIRRLHQSIPSGRTNGSLTQQIIKGIISIILGSTELAKPHWHKLLHKNRNVHLYFECNSGVKDIRDVIEKAKQSGGLFTAKNLFFL